MDTLFYKSKMNYSLRCLKSLDNNKILSIKDLESSMNDFDKDITKDKSKNHMMYC